jgi:hypothetical protein
MNDICPSLVGNYIEHRLSLTFFTRFDNFELAGFLQDQLLSLSEILQFCGNPIPCIQLLGEKITGLIQSSPDEIDYHRLSWAVLISGFLLTESGGIGEISTIPSNLKNELAVDLSLLILQKVVGFGSSFTLIEVGFWFVERWSKAWLLNDDEKYVLFLLL